MPRVNHNKRNMVFVHSYYRAYPKTDKDRREIQNWLEENKQLLEKGKAAKKWEIIEPKLVPVPEVPEERKGMTWKEQIDRIWKVNAKIKANMENADRRAQAIALNIKGREGMRAYFITPSFIQFAVERFPELKTGTIHERYDKIVEEFEKRSGEKVNSQFIKAIVFELLI